MQDHVGDSFEGVVSSVTNFGLFVRLTDYHIDGLVHITSLEDDSYRYDDVKQMLIGETGARQFRLGDNITVKVAAVNLDERKIDLVLDAAMVRNRSGKKVKVRESGKSGRKDKSTSKPRNDNKKTGKSFSGKGKKR